MIKKLLYVTIVLMAFKSNIQAQLVYKDVAPIFIQRCTPCHHQGKIFPAFTYYSSVSLYKALITYDLQNNKMPPWSPDTSYVRFAHERIITASEKTKILNWISAGAPAGDTTLAPPVPHYPTTQLNGTPDLILTIPTYTSNATTTDRYVCFSLPTGLTQNRILRAYEVIPGNAPMVHHAVINVDTMGTTSTDLSGMCFTIPGDFSLGAYAPGAPPTVFPGVAPAKFGVTIKAGSKIVLQMHYPAGTAGQTDATQIRLFFYPLNTTGIRQIYAATPLQNWAFNIPANTTNTVSAHYPNSGGITADISAYSIFPHSHKICKSIENYASNGTNTIPLCRINKWDFEWQGFYTFKNLLKIPAGYTLYGKHIFDNTTANPNNPTPVTVYAGLSTTDEMVFDGLMWALYQPGDENIDIKSILDADTLFSLPNNLYERNAYKTQVVTYPNPFTDKVTIAYELFSTEYVTVSIYNIMGQKVSTLSSRTETPGIYTYEWNGKTQEGAQVAPGIYTYKVNIGATENCGKIILNPKN